MAAIQTDTSGNHHITFRFGGRRFKRSLKTKSLEVAETQCLRLEETIRLVESGRIEIPPGVDIPLFLLSDGKLTAKKKLTAPQHLTQLFQRYFDSLPPDNLEESTMNAMKIHQRHFERHLGKTFQIHSLSRDHLQSYIGKRAKEKGIRGRSLSSVTIRKELVTFRAVWNWAIQHELVETAFPMKGLRFPKGDEKPRFQTYEEIVPLCNAPGMTDAKKADLWDCLFLTRKEIEEVLDIVKKNARHPWIYPMFVAAAHTGARRSELMRSQWIDMDATHLTLHERKRVRGQRSQRRVPMTARLKEALGQWRAVYPGGSHMFALLDGRHSLKDRSVILPLTRDETNDHFKRTLAGTKWEVIRGWHCFRHSFCSNCAMQGVDQRLIDAWVGHTTDAMRRRYRHLFPSQERSVIESVFG